MGDLIDDISDGIDTIVDFFDTIYDFITDFIDNLLLLFEYIGAAADMAYSFISTMPTWLQSFATITIVVSVIYMIVGRSAGGKKE